MHKYLLLTGVFVIVLVLFFTFAYFALKSAGKTRSPSRFWNHDKDTKPDLDWDNFDCFQSSYYGKPRIFEAQCVSVQPRTYEDLQKSEEKLADSSSSASVNEENSSEAACKLKFTLQYNTVSSTLVIHLLAAKHLFHQEKGSAAAYYVVMKIIPQTHRTFHTRAIKSEAPELEFNEIFEFQVNEQDLLQQNLKVILCFFDRFSHHDVIGELRVDLADLESRGLMLSREILLCKEINRIHKTPFSGAEIMLSLGYLRLTERLAVVVIAAKNLPTLDTGRPPDPYVEVRLQHGGRLLKHKKTHPKIKDCNPVFNESLTFHIPHGILHQSSLIICMKHEDESDMDIQLGQVFLGPEATGLQFEHWNEMRVNRKPIARWHKLQSTS